MDRNSAQLLLTTLISKPTAVITLVAPDGTRTGRLIEQKGSTGFFEDPNSPLGGFSVDLVNVDSVIVEEVGKPPVTYR